MGFKPLLPLRLAGLCLPAFLPLHAAGQAMPAEHAALLDSYCSECHNSDDWAGSLDLQLMNLRNVTDDAETWEKVMRKFRGNMMPPVGNPRPAEAEKSAFTAWLERAIDEATLAAPNPGPSSLHRLNRTEYGNAIRDLLHLQVDIAEYLPADDEGYGFDNIADVLRTSPSLLEQYLGASHAIAELAVGDPAMAPVSRIYRVPPDLPQAQHIPGLPLGTRGGILIEHNFPLDADYDFSAFLTRNIVGYMTGLEWPHEFEISIDGERVFSAIVGGEEDNLRSDTNFAEAGDAIDDRLQVRVPVTAGLHRVAVTFVDKNAAETHEPLELHTRDLDLQNMNGLPTLDYVDITGPFNPTGPGDTASRRRLFTCYPQSAAEEESCAGEILATLARRAFRGQVDEQDLGLIMDIYRQGRGRGGFERGIQSALRLVLTSPAFLFRAEADPEGAAPGEVHPLSGLALASRLSFFLWSSIPDDELLRIAESGRLHEPEVLEGQVARMLRDPRATALVDNFAAQWLLLRNLQSVNPDIRSFPDFDHKLKEAFRAETELFVASIIREDRSVLDLLEADYTFVNDRLAAHYGIPSIYGSHFRRVRLAEPARRGLLGQGSILTVTSYPNRTSPVLRGKWVMENILGTPPPPPPPNVPDLEEVEPGGAFLSVRERLIAHQENPSCSGCHSVLDPLGFALENFDAVGRYREKDEAGLIDSSGSLADGTPVQGAQGLREILARHPEYFVQTLTEKLLTYALGRGLEHYDMPVVRRIVREAAADDYRFSAVVQGIARSVPFTMRKATGQAQATLSLALEEGEREAGAARSSAGVNSR